jgi:LEA14-like dessication related protein
MKHLRIWLALLLVAALSACAALGVERLRVNVAGIESLSSEGLEARFALKLRVQNPNDIALDYDGIALDLSVNGAPFASGVSNAKGSVPRFGETVITVPITVSALSVVRQALSFTRNPPKEGVPYELKGRLAGTGLGSLRFESSGTLRFGGAGEPAAPKPAGS